MELYYTNIRGGRIDLLNAPEYILTAQTGLTGLPSNDLSEVESVIAEGSRISNARRGSRQIVLTHRFVRDVRESRRAFVETLDLNAPGKIRYRDGQLDVYADVWVESCEVSNTNEGGTTATTTFRMPFPYFVDTSETIAVNSYLTPAWSFPFTFPVTFGSTSGTSQVSIVNASNVPQGFEMTVEAVGGRLNLESIVNQLGEGLYPQSGWTSAQIENGDALEISTVDGDKRFDYYDASEETVSNLMHRLTLGSQFFKLQPGENVITFNVRSTSAYLRATIRLRTVRKGV